MANRFKNSILRAEYNASMFAFDTKHQNLFINGERRQSPDLGSTFATFFWAGYDGKNQGMFKFDSTMKNTLSYAYYKAGIDARKKDASYA